MTVDSNDPCQAGGRLKRGIACKREDWHPLICGVWLVVVGIGAYHNSFSGPFIFDDISSIVDNPTIRRLWPIWHALVTPLNAPVAGRPVVNFSFAINYAAGGLQVWGYHVFNLGVHLVAALTLFAIVRRTLRCDRLQDRSRNGASALALVSALLWVVHPLQTESVTYISQRAESLMGLMYLLMLYSVIRAGADTPNRRWWYAGAIGTCALGMGSKPVMVTAPMMALLYDRVFIAKSFGQLFRQRWSLYAGLATTWVLLPVFLAAAPHQSHSAGFTFPEITPIEYAATQPGVILQYLKLAFWPYPLCLDYAWPIQQDSETVVRTLLLVTLLILSTVWALRHQPALGFLGAWFLVILSVTSSVMPLADPMAEHRMYLPLAAVTTLVVLGGWRLLCRLVPAADLRRSLGVGLTVVTVGLLAWMTVRRNDDYRTARSIWEDTVAKRPDNPRAHTNLGNALTAQERFDEAVFQYTEALRLQPALTEPTVNLGAVLALKGVLDDAAAHAHLGAVLAVQGNFEAAAAHFSESLRVNPENASAHNGFANTLAGQGKLDEAVAHYQEALRLRPDYAAAHSNLAHILIQQGKLEEAITHCLEALRLQPHYAKAHYNLGVALTKQGKRQEAAKQFEAARQLTRRRVSYAQ